MQVSPCDRFSPSEENAQYCECEYHVDDHESVGVLVASLERQLAEARKQAFMEAAKIADDLIHNAGGVVIALLREAEKETNIENQTRVSESVARRYEEALSCMANKKAPVVD